MVGEAPDRSGVEDGVALNGADACPGRVEPSADSASVAAPAAARFTTVRRPIGTPATIVALGASRPLAQVWGVQCGREAAGNGLPGRVMRVPPRAVAVPEPFAGGHDTIER